MYINSPVSLEPASSFTKLYCVCSNARLGEENVCPPMSSKRSTHTTNTFVSGPSGGKDFPVDDLLVFTNGLSCRYSTAHGEVN